MYIKILNNINNEQKYTNIVYLKKSLMKRVAYLSEASREYKTGESVLVALQPTSLEFRANELTLILGPSGSGKTTLLSLLGCVIFPTTGKVFVDDILTESLSERELARLRSGKIGFVFQNFNLIAPLTVVENVMQPLLLNGMKGSKAREMALAALKKVNMDSRANDMPGNLSGGQKQRVAIARALVTEPELVLCDEPTASLDHGSATLVMEELKMLSRSGKAVIVVTHDQRLKQYADRIIYVNDGFASEKESYSDLFN